MQMKIVIGLASAVVATALLGSVVGRVCMGEWCATLIPASVALYGCTLTCFGLASGNATVRAALRTTGTILTALGLWLLLVSLL